MEKRTFTVNMDEKKRLHAASMKHKKIAHDIYFIGIVLILFLGGSGVYDLVMGKTGYSPYVRIVLALLIGVLGFLVANNIVSAFGLGRKEEELSIDDRTIEYVYREKKSGKHIAGCFVVNIPIDELQHIVFDHVDKTILFYGTVLSMYVPDFVAENDLDRSELRQTDMRRFEIHDYFEPSFIKALAEICPDLIIGDKAAAGVASSSSKDGGENE
ncbi:MAG: hypothetical protein ACI4LM_02195 [Anaerovoracaceae bacterium]